MLKIIRRAEKLKILSISKTTNHGKEQRGESCKSFKLSDRAAGYVEQHVLTEAAALSCGYTSKQMQEIVRKLESQREELLADLLAQIDNLVA